MNKREHKIPKGYFHCFTYKSENEQTNAMTNHEKNDKKKINNSILNTVHRNLKKRFTIEIEINR